MSTPNPVMGYGLEWRDIRNDWVDLHLFQVFIHCQGLSLLQQDSSNSGRPSLCSTKQHQTVSLLPVNTSTQRTKSSLALISPLFLFVQCSSSFLSYTSTLWSLLFSVHFTFMLFCARGHLQGGTSSVTSSSSRRVRQLPQLPPKSSSVEQGTVFVVHVC